MAFSRAPAATYDRRWLALIVVCLGSLMIVLDGTIVNVALPSIRKDLGFSEANLAWVVNAYMLTFGGFLLLAGRLGDRFGHRRLFLLGLTLFTLASLGCSFATTQSWLIGARAIQGFGGAVVSSVALSILMTLFTDPADRARAMGVFGFVSAGGGSLGVVLGGVLTGTLNWHWIFLVNVPVGVLVFALSLMLLPAPHAQRPEGPLDFAGAATVTAALMVAVYAIVTGTPALLIVSLVLVTLFLGIESRVRSPLVPLGLFRYRNLTVANVASILWSAGFTAWFFLSALYLQLVLGYTPLQVGLAFLPGSLIMGALSLGVSARLVMRFGIRTPLAAGLLLCTAGLLLLAAAPVGGHFVTDVLPSMVLIGFGGGIAFNPILLAATDGIGPADSGLVAGVVNSAFMMGGALGLAILASAAGARTARLLAAGHGQLAALTAGYHAAFILGAMFSAAAAAAGVALLRVSPRTEPTAREFEERSIPEPT